MADQTYQVTFAKAVKSLGIDFDDTSRPEDRKRFVVEAKSRVVERTIALVDSSEEL